MSGMGFFINLEIIEYRKIRKLDWEGDKNMRYKYMKIDVTQGEEIEVEEDDILARVDKRIDGGATIHLLKAIGDGDSDGNGDDDGDGYTLVWNDEFDSLDKTKWLVIDWGGQNFKWDNISIRDSNLVIKSDKNIRTSRIDTGNDYTKTFDYPVLVPGVEGSEGAETRKEIGYRVDIRAKLGMGMGVDYQIWFNTNLWRNEIDLLEGGKYMDERNLALHSAMWCELKENKHCKYGGTQHWVSNNGSTGEIYNPIADGQYHIYSIECFTDRLVYKIDGNIRYTITGSYIPTNPMKIILGVCARDCHTGDKIWNVPDDQLPREFLIDYVRVYKWQRFSK